MTIMTNLLPDLNPWEYDALKESIRRWKVILPVVKDENGDIIDGYQRVRVCNELGITDYPVLTLRGLTEDDKRDHALILNLLKRHLNQQQMRDLIAAELKSLRIFLLGNSRYHQWYERTLSTERRPTGREHGPAISTDSGSGRPPTPPSSRSPQGDHSTTDLG